MKANELRIGNFVKVSDSQPFQITGIFNDYVWALIQETYFPISDLSGVTLTEEWLLKFGFENWGKKRINDYEEELEYVLFNVIDGSESFKVVLIESNYGEIITKEYVIRIGHETLRIHRCKFIHDIQNAYYIFAGHDISIPHNRI